MTREELLKGEIVTDRKINEYLKGMSFTEISKFMSENSKIIKNSSGEDVLTLLAYIDDDGNLIKMLDASEEEQRKIADKQTGYKDALFNNKKELKKLEKIVNRFSRVENIYRKISEKEEKEKKLSPEEKLHLIRYRRYRIMLVLISISFIFISVATLLRSLNIYTINTVNIWYSTISLIVSIIQLLAIFAAAKEFWENNNNN